MNVCAHTRLAELTAALPGLPTVAGTEPERMRATGTYYLRTGVQDRPRQRQHRERGSARSGAEWRRETGAARETGDAQENLRFQERRGKAREDAPSRNKSGCQNTNRTFRGWCGGLGAGDWALAGWKRRLWRECFTTASPLWGSRHVQS